MRRLTPVRESARDERGAVAVMFAMMLVPLLVILAFVGDAGLLYWEKAELQNGADAAALAVAQNCIQDGAGCSIDANAVAAAIAGRNANDGASDAVIDPAQSSLQQSHGKVFVTASSPEGNGVPHPFVSLVIPQAATTLYATASVEWGAPVSGTTLPLAIGSCEFEEFPPLDPVDPNPSKILVKYNTTARAGCDPTYAPGGFGWLDAEDCHADIDLVDGVIWHVGDSGNSIAKSGCDAATDIAPLRGTTILIPIYDSFKKEGGVISFHIAKFAAFMFTGFKLSGSDAYVDPTAPPCTGSCRGLQGYFVRYVELGEDFELGDGTGGPDGGLTIVRFTS